MNRQMSKQDRQGVRTASDIEQKYNLGDISKNQDTGSKQALQIQQLNQDLANYMSKTNAKIEELEENDKMWFYSGAPTLENHPAVDWTTDELKAKHIGDMYYDVDNGDMYLFKSTDGVYAWESCFGSGVDYDAAYQEGYGNGYTEGVASVPNPLEFAKQLYNTYLQTTFPENTEFTINVPNVTRMTSCFQQATGIVKLIVKGNVAGNAIECNSAFRINTLITLDLTEFIAKISNAQTMYGGDTLLKEIKGTLDLSSATNVTNMFYNCTSLEEVRFAENSIALSISVAQSSKLSAETVQSIIDGLTDLTGVDAQTLTLHATVKATLTEDQIAQITSKNWLLA